MRFTPPLANLWQYLSVAINVSAKFYMPSSKRTVANYIKNDFDRNLSALILGDMFCSRLCKTRFRWTFDMDD